MQCRFRCLLFLRSCLIHFLLLLDEEDFFDEVLSLEDDLLLDFLFDEDRCLHCLRPLDDFLSLHLMPISLVSPVTPIFTDFPSNFNICLHCLVDISLGFAQNYHRKPAQLRIYWFSNIFYCLIFSCEATL